MTARFYHWKVSLKTYRTDACSGSAVFLHVLHRSWRPSLPGLKPSALEVARTKEADHAVNTLAFSSHSLNYKYSSQIPTFRHAAFAAATSKLIEH